MVMDFIKIFGTTCIVLLIGFSPIIIGNLKKKIKTFLNYRERLKPKMCFSSYREEDPYLIFPKPPKKPKFEMINRNGCKLNYKNILGIFWIFEDEKWILVGEYNTEYNCNVVVIVNDNYYLAEISRDGDIKLNGSSEINKSPKNITVKIIGKVIYESSK